MAPLVVEVPTPSPTKVLKPVELAVRSVAPSSRYPTDDVALKLPARALVPRSLEPATESARHGVVVPMPTFPFARTTSPLAPPAVNAPAKVDVAVVDVAVIYKTVGDVEETSWDVPPFEYIHPCVKLATPVPPNETGTFCNESCPVSEMYERGVLAEIAKLLLPPPVNIVLLPVAEIIGFSGVPLIVILSPALIELIIFDAKMRPVPVFISVPFVIMPLFARIRPPKTEEPITCKKLLSLVVPFTVAPPTILVFPPIVIFFCTATLALILNLIFRDFCKVFNEDRDVDNAVCAFGIIVGINCLLLFLTVLFFEVEVALFIAEFDVLLVLKNTRVFFDILFIIVENVLEKLPSRPENTFALFSFDTIMPDELLSPSTLVPIK